MKSKARIKNLIRRLGAGKLLWRLIGFSQAWVEPVLFAGPAFIFYIGLVLAKVILKKKYVFCWINGFRIGHLAANTELFLRRLKNTDYYNKNNIYIGFCYYFPICNHQLLKMFKRVLPIIESRLFEKLMNTWIKNTEFSHRLPFNSNEYYEYNNFEPRLTFTAEERKRGRQLLSQLGIGENDWFVCFHARDSKYLGAGSEHLDYRNSDINNYLKAAEYLAEKGGHVIRMGAAVDKPLPHKRHSRIIDYALENRSDFMDVYLSAHCKFFLGNTAGIHGISMIFGIPVALANYIPIDVAPYRKEDLFIQKKLWSEKEKRILSYQEIFRLGVELYWETDQYVKAGIRLIENAADEILELAREMNMRIDGNFEISDKDEELQKKFQSLFKPTNHSYGSPARIGAFFLRTNEILLRMNMDK